MARLYHRLSFNEAWPHAADLMSFAPSSSSSKAINTGKSRTRMRTNRPLLRFVSNFENDLPARVSSRYLLMRLHRFRKRECLRHDHLDFLVIDQFADLGKLF